jgi:hypothetical protein
MGSSLALNAVEKGNRVHLERPSCRSKQTDSCASVSAFRSASCDAVCIPDRRRPPDKPLPVEFPPNSVRPARSGRPFRAKGSSLALTAVEKGKRVHQERSCRSSKRADSCASVSAIRFRVIRRCFSPGCAWQGKGSPATSGRASVTAKSGEDRVTAAN